MKTPITTTLTAAVLVLSSTSLMACNSEPVVTHVVPAPVVNHEPQLSNCGVCGTHHHFVEIDTTAFECFARGYLAAHGLDLVSVNFDAHRGNGVYRVRVQSQHTGKFYITSISYGDVAKSHRHQAALGHVVAGYKAAFSK